MDNVPNAKQLKVVIVEDNEPLADIYKTRLELIGYKCFIAYDGEAALDLIRRELPDLVLLDLMVPKIAGDEILRRMRGSDWGKKIRVFIISNLNEVDAPKGLRDLGIEGYIIKANLSNDQLDQLVDNILRPTEQTESTSLEEQTIIPHDNEPAEQVQPIAEQQAQTQQDPSAQETQSQPANPSESPSQNPQEAQGKEEEQQLQPEQGLQEQKPSPQQTQQPESGQPDETQTEPPQEFNQKSL